MVILRQSVSCNLRHAVMKKFSFNCLFVLLACTSCVTFSSALDSGLQYHTTSDGILHDSGCTKCCDIPYQSSNILQDIKSCSGPYFFVGVQAQPSIYEFGAFAAAMEMKTETKIERPYNFLYSAPDASFPLLDAAFLDQQNLDVSLRTQNSKLPLEWTRTIFSCPDPSAVAKFQRAAAWNSLIAGIQSHLVSSREPSQLSSGLNLRQEPSLVQTHISFRNLGQSSSEASAYVSDFSISLVIGICGLGGCALGMLIAFAFKMRTHRTAMQKLHAKIDSLLLQQKQARRLREKDMQERFKKMGEELRGTTKAGDYVAGSPTGVNEYCGSPNYDSC